MESQGIRGTTLTVAGSNNENEVGMGPAAAKGRVLRAKRTAMTDIGNKANILQNAKNQIVKKEAIKPARGLSKQKATTSLAQLVPQVVPTTRVTRKSAELKKDNEGKCIWYKMLQILCLEASGFSLLYVEFPWACKVRCSQIHDYLNF